MTIVAQQVTVRKDELHSEYTKEVPTLTMTSQITEFLETVPEREIPHPVMDAVELAFVDTIAAMWAGLRFDATRIVLEHPLHATSGPLMATIVGDGRRRALADAALIHGVMAHVADYDDVSWALMGHPSATLIPAILSLAEAVGSSGDQAIRAYVAGYEVAVALGRAAGPAHYLRGWHATSTIGSIGVAAACSVLLALDSARTRNALGIAASSSSGLRQNFGSDVKSLHAGFAARNGIEAAMLALEGYTADADALGGRWGFFRAFNEATGTSLGDDVLSTGAVLDPGTLRKLYPSCGATHQAIDASRAIRSQRSAARDEIVGVEVGVAPACLAPLLARPPRTPLEAKFSMEYCVATALLTGNVRSAQFTADGFGHAAVMSLMPSISMVASSELADIPENANDASAARVTVRYLDGESRSVLVRDPSGSPRNPLSTEELRTKLHDCGEGVVSAESIERAHGIIMNLRSQPDLTDLVDSLTP